NPRDSPQSAPKVQGTFSMRHRIRWLAFSLSVLSLGCSVPPPWDMPDLTNPGPAAYQQRRANPWDIYPETAVGPALDGARAREFATSNPEPARARWSFWPFSGQ